MIIIIKSFCMCRVHEHRIYGGARSETLCRMDCKFVEIFYVFKTQFSCS